ncbi:MAG: hypothetical protein LBC82_04490 [Oscillospiraceae bacterium]|jgi:hypothetical protein|nr:hypothetical protein [Oscillospiraceae bacterium]
MNKYVIKSITDLSGVPKRDSKSTQRVGSMVTMLESAVAGPLGYTYVTDNNGEIKEGSFTGGTVRTFNANQVTGDIEAVTSDSIYKFAHAGTYGGDNEYVNKMLGDSEIKTSITRTGVDDITCIDLDTLLKEIK